MRISDWSSDVCSSDLILVQMLQPGVLMPVGKHEKQTSDLDAPAGAQKGHQVSGAQVREPLKDHIQVMEARMIGQFIERLEAGALRRRHLEWPAPGRSDEGREGKRVSGSVDLGGRRVVKKK